jgi:predicted regulator of Ras-like GTPase activity (Roadblock/LC7/MglB family)
MHKSKLYDRILTNVIRKMSAGSVMLLNNDGLKIAEQTCGLDDSEGIWGSANRLIDAGERALKELHMDRANFVNQIFESENFFLMVGPVNPDISYAILSSKVNKIPLGMLRLFAQSLKDEVEKVDEGS